MTRRQFIKGAAVAVSRLPLLSDQLPFMDPLPMPQRESDLVIAKSGSPSQLLQAAMAPLGGMGRFVKKGQRVVIKANIAWARTPEQACTNNPELLSALIKMCYEAGAKRVAVWDHTCDNYQFTFSRSGLKEAAQKAGADVFSGHGRNVYKQVEIPKAKKLKTAEILRDVLESDVFINFPIPKQHFATELTLGMKNLIGNRLGHGAAPQDRPPPVHRRYQYPPETGPGRDGCHPNSHHQRSEGTWKDGGSRWR